MKVVIQRSKAAHVMIDGEIAGAIDEGLVLLLGIEENDTETEIDWLCNKIVNLRIFSDKEGKMNLSLRDIEGDILLISQFTLHASTKKGNRPSFIKAARPEQAIPLYEGFKDRLHQLTGREIQTGEFGADMKVHLINDGPVTIIIDSLNRE